MGVRFPLGAPFLPKYRKREHEELVDYVRKNGLPAGFSMDHDLGEGMTGYDAALEIARMIFEGELEYRPFEWKVHSMNPVGAERIAGVFKMVERYFGNRVE